MVQKEHLKYERESGAEKRRTSKKGTEKRAQGREGKDPKSKPEQGGRTETSHSLKASTFQNRKQGSIKGPREESRARAETLFRKTARSSSGRRDEFEGGTTFRNLCQLGEHQKSCRSKGENEENLRALREDFSRRCSGDAVEKTETPSKATVTPVLHGPLHRGEKRDP